MVSPRQGNDYSVSSYGVSSSENADRGGDSAALKPRTLEARTRPLSYLPPNMGATMLISEREGRLQIQVSQTISVPPQFHTFTSMYQPMEAIMATTSTIHLRRYILHQNVGVVSTMLGLFKPLNHMTPSGEVGATIAVELEVHTSPNLTHPSLCPPHSSPPKCQR